MSSVEDVRTILGSEFPKLPFTVETVGEIIKVKLTKKIPTQDFAKFAGFIEKKFGGEWIKLGRDSHFKVPRQQQSSSQTPIEHRWANELEVIVGELEAIIADLRR